MVSQDERLQKNRELLARITPQVAFKLQDLKPNRTRWVQTRKKEPNLEVQSSGETFFLHSNYSAEKEAQEWVKSLQIKPQVNVLFVFGVGLGYLFDALLPWLEESPGHYLVFIEDDMEVLYRLMQTEKGTAILDHKQVQLHFLSSFQEADPMFQWIAWFFVLTHPEVAALRSYEKHKEERFVELRSRLMHDSVFADSVAAEYMRYGKSFFRNFYRNMLHLDQSHHGNGLFGKFSGVPAIICGAGPSLDKNWDVLKTLENHALIFAGGSSLNALSSKGVLPHFGAGIDPNPPQYERLISNYGYEVPFFYRNRMFYEAFQAIHGNRLYLTGAGGYDISDWFDEKLEIPGEEVDEGHNVVNFCVEIARNLGCSPIIFVGMDLSYTKLKAYAEGVVVQSEVSEGEILDAPSADLAAFKRNDIYGNPVYTLWKWVNESQWISEYAASHPQTRFINATEGGIGFEGVENRTLQEVKEQYLQVECDLPGWVHAEIQQAELPQVTSEKVLEGMKEIRESLYRVKELTQGLMDENDEIKKRLESHKKVPESLQTGRAALFEEELHEELAYSKALSLSAQVCNKVLARRIHQIRYDKGLKNERERQLELVDVNRQKYAFVLEAAETNLHILEEAVRDHQKKGHAIGDFLERAKEKVEQ